MLNLNEEQKNGFSAEYCSVCFNLFGRILCMYKKRSLVICMHGAIRLFLWNNKFKPFYIVLILGPLLIYALCKFVKWTTEVQRKSI